MKIKILIPIYNDWQSVFKLLENIDSEITGLDAEVSVLIVNDASTEQRPEINFNLNNLKSVQVINMKENRGHARCNASGLKYINEKEDFDYVIPMDGDGEDRPEEIKLLIDKIKEYPDMVVAKIAEEAATWSSFSGSLSKTAKVRKSVPSIRGSRYFGPSKMSFINLLKHSLSIIAVFKFTVLIRSIIFLAVYIFLVLKYISIITLIPVVLVIAMIVSVFVLSGRENITELNNSLENINNIENLK